MQPFTNKELYMMNGGQKQYIGKDGFWDVYTATPEEEKEWAKELVEKALLNITSEDETIALQIAMENLAFQKYRDQISVLVNRIPGSSPARQLVFATSLWYMNCNERDFEKVFEILLQLNASCLTAFFEQPGDFKHHPGARYFLIKCLQGNDEYLFEKAQTILSIWAWSGLPELRENRVLDHLEFNKREWPTWKAAIVRLKEILITNN
ncbi:MAG: hypothetical protein ABI091_02250 [Ferruginibacter sp.]